jgi:hypothetical protein
LPETLKIVALGVFAAVAYGIVHDSVTTRVCVEYFTVGHPPILGGTRSPWLLSLGWGVIATWWVGFGLGLLMAFACRSGSRPRLPAADLLRPLARLLVIMAVVSFVAGVAGYLSARAGWVWLHGFLAETIPRERHPLFIADLWAHLAAYASAFVGGVTLVIRASLRRTAMAAEARRPPVPTD